MMRGLLIAVVSLALTSCWLGRSLYAPSDARLAIRPGVYQVTEPDKDKRVYRVSVLPNGLTQFDTGEKAEVYGFAPLDRNTFVFWVQIDDAGPKDPNQLYGLAVRQSDGVFMLYLPECKDAQAEIARRNGAVIEEGTSPACQFLTRASLEKAIRSIPLDESSALRLSRIP